MSKRDENGASVLLRVREKLACSSNLFSVGSKIACGSEPQRIPDVNRGVIAFILKGVLSKEECELLIEACPFSGAGYMSSGDVVMNYRDRVVNRYASEDPHLSDLIMSRISPYLPTEIDGGSLSGMSPQWRFLRYDSGGYQGAHIDGRECREIPEAYYVQSRFTCQMYLNDSATDYEGGELVFKRYNDELDALEDKYVVRPAAGDCVVFYQERETSECLHEAREVLTGSKFAMRSMIEYKWSLEAATYNNRNAT